MQFQQVLTTSGGVDQSNILYTDDSGVVWLVPNDHRFWVLYQDWLSQGNTPLPAN